MRDHGVSLRARASIVQRVREWGGKETSVLFSRNYHDLIFYMAESNSIHLLMGV